MVEVGQIASFYPPFFMFFLCSNLEKISWLPNSNLKKLKSIFQKIASESLEFATFETEKKIL